MTVEQIEKEIFRLGTLWQIKTLLIYMKENERVFTHSGEDRFRISLGWKKDHVIPTIRTIMYERENPIMWGQDKWVYIPHYLGKHVLLQWIGFEDMETTLIHFYENLWTYVDRPVEGSYNGKLVYE